MANLKYKHTAYTSAQWASLNPVIVENEIVIESDTKRTKIGNGISTYNQLGYADANSIGNSLGSIKPTDAAPTPQRNGNYTFSIGGNKPAWLTAEAGVTTVKAGDGVAVVYDGVSAYTYTHVKIDRIADIYNVTVEIPLAVGQYYTSSTARAAVPAINRAKGKELTYEISAGVWVNEKFVGSDVINWNIASNWAIQNSALYDFNSGKGVSNTNALTATGTAWSISNGYIGFLPIVVGQKYAVKLGYSGSKLVSWNIQIFSNGALVGVQQGGISVKDTYIEFVALYSGDQIRSYVVMSEPESANATLTVKRVFEVVAPIAESVVQGHIKNTLGASETDIINQRVQSALYDFNSGKGVSNTTALTASGTALSISNGFIGFLPIIAGQKYAVKMDYSGSKLTNWNIQIFANGALVGLQQNGLVVNGSYIEFVATYSGDQIRSYVSMSSPENANAILTVKRVFETVALITTTELTAYAQDATADYTGNNCIQEAIDYANGLATAQNKFIIKFKGIVKASTPAEFTKNAGSGQVAFIFNSNPYIELVGYGYDKSIIIGELANNLGGSFLYENYNVVRWEADSNPPKDIFIIGKNMRYPLHIDGGQINSKNFASTISHLNVWNQGNDGDAVNWGSWHPIGLGMSDGQILNIEDTILKGKKWGFYVHTNLEFNNPCKVLVKRSIIEKGDGSNDVMLIQQFGTGQKDKVIFENCQIAAGEIKYTSYMMTSKLVRQLANDAEIDLIMNILPLPFNNYSLLSKGLKITSKTTGATSTVSFDETSTAFDAIIGDSTKDIDFINERNKNEVFDYEYKNGINGLSGWAAGLKDVSEGYVGSGTLYYIKSLGKRLGDCSSVNKTLTIIIDGITYNVIFNKDYNGTASTVAPNYTNAQIITEIETVIGSVATVGYYFAGQEYYPKFKDVKVMVNADIVEVYSGMGVVKNGLNTFRIALTTDDHIDGICIDDGGVGNECRIIPRGSLIYSGYRGYRFVANEVSIANRTPGTIMYIGATPGKFSTSGTYPLLKCVWDNVFEIL